MNSLSVFIEKFETFIVRLATAERVKIYPRLIFTIGILTWGILILGGNGVIDAAGNLLGEDFLSFYTIARFYIEDNLHLFYDTAAQKAYHSTITGDEQGVGAFLNPPFVALLYYPFGTGSYLQGILTWWAFGILLFLSSLYLLQKYLLMDRMDYKGVITISLLFMPTVYWLAYGQISGILFFILALSFIFLREGKEYTAGFVLGLLAFKPQIALGLALPILFKFRWRAIIGGITSSTIWILLGLWLFPDQMAQYILERKEILSYIYDPNFPSWGVHTQYGFFHLLFRDVNAEIINIISWFFFFVSVAWLYWIWRPIDWETKSPSWNLMIAISLVMGLSVSIHLFVSQFSHSLVLCLSML